MKNLSTIRSKKIKIYCKKLCRQNDLLAFFVEKVKTVKIGKSLRETRLAAGVVSESFYSKVERGIHNIDADTLIEILKANHINPVQFFSKTLDGPIQESPHKKSLQDASFMANKIANSANKRDLEKLGQLKKEIDQAEEQGKPYYIWIPYILELMTAWITHSTDDISEPVKKKIQHLSKGNNWGFLNYEYLGMAFIALTPEQVINFSHTAYQRYERNLENSLSSPSTIGIADLSINFLMCAYIHNFDKKLCAESFAFFDKNIPYEASFYQHRVIVRLYKTLFDNDTEKVDFYTRLLEEDNFTFCLQNVPVAKKDGSHAH
jgi:transcriptional regulator with XRE-family HTH domain